MSKTHESKFAGRVSSCTESGEAAKLLNNASRLIGQFSEGNDVKAEIEKRLAKSNDKLEKMMMQDFLSRLTGADDAARIATHDATAIWKGIRSHFDEMFNRDKIAEMNAVELLEISKTLTKLYNEHQQIFAVKMGK